ncbi:MAG: AAA family ATPase, partial [Campylobacterota bacterium]|nr:AAA family ATPase [Campylobacterota bacterium]
MIAQLIKYSTAKLTQTLPSYQRFLFKKIDFSSKLIGIIGARGAGKTTLALQYLKQLDMSTDEFLYISCDHPLIASKTLFEIAEEFSQYGGKVLVIDEIHKKENFCIELKNIYDFFSIQVLFTGSSAIHLENCQSDLSRRALIYRLPELSFREYIELKTEHRFDAVSLENILDNHLDMSNKVMEKIKPLKYYEAYIKSGAYPIFLEGEESYLQRLIEIINETITSDIATIYNVPVKNTASLHKLLEVICRSEPYEINYEKISTVSGISRN